MCERTLLTFAVAALAACDNETCPLVGTDGPAVVVDVVAQGDVTAVLMSDGTGFCWGEDLGGECGFGVAGYSSSPHPMEATFCLVQASLQTNGMSAGLSPNGVVRVWGREAGLSQAGDGPGQSNYVAKAGRVGLPAAEIVVSGDSHMLAITGDGIVYWWGSVAYAWSEGTVQDQFRADFPERLPFEERCQALSVGRNASCVLDDAGGVWCFGANHFGQLGKQPSPVGQLEPVPIVLPQRAIEIAAAHETFCAVLENRELYCWGLLPGSGSVDEWVLPTRIDGAVGVGLAVGGGHLCVLDDAGAATCTGKPSAFGVKGGIDDPPLPPFQWMPDLRFRKLALGLLRTCGLTIDQRVYCAGSYAGLGPNGPREGFVDIEAALRKREAEEEAK
jgi:hypothetical protein